MFAKVFTRAMKASLHRGHGGIERLSDFRVAAAFLDEGKQGAILGPQLV
jgi:hypothetical protein